jgi:hypothetical protein
MSRLSRPCLPPARARLAPWGYCSGTVAVLCCLGHAFRPPAHAIGAQSFLRAAARRQTRRRVGDGRFMHTTGRGRRSDGRVEAIGAYWRYCRGTAGVLQGYCRGTVQEAAAGGWKRAERTGILERGVRRADGPLNRAPLGLAIGLDWVSVCADGLRRRESRRLVPDDKHGVRRCLRRRQRERRECTE